MIRPLRRRHRFVTSVMAVVLPVLFLLALRARTAVPLDTGVGLVEPTANAAAGTTVQTWDWAAVEVTTRRVRADPAGSSDLLVTSARDDLRRPDLLLYTATRPATDALPASARLVAPLVGTEPVIAPGDAAWLILYSLGHDRVVDQLAPAGPEP